MPIFLFTSRKSTVLKNKLSRKLWNSNPFFRHLINPYSQHILLTIFAQSSRYRCPGYQRGIKCIFCAKSFNYAFAGRHRRRRLVRECCLLLYLHMYVYLSLYLARSLTHPLTHPMKIIISLSIIGFCSSICFYSDYRWRSDWCDHKRNENGKKIRKKLIGPCSCNY